MALLNSPTTSPSFEGLKKQNNQLITITSTIESPQNPNEQHTQDYIDMNCKETVQAFI